MNIAEIKKAIIEKEREKRDLESRYKEELSELEFDISKLNEKYEMEINGVNSMRVSNALRYIFVTGMEHVGKGSTHGCIRDAIELILEHPEKIKERYLGCKNYSSFICQRSDHPYGYGPSHGSIVFSIEATAAYRKGEIELDEEAVADIVYFLENVRQRKLLSNSHKNC